jgi:hypothetical protein
MHLCPWKASRKRSSKGQVGRRYRRQSWLDPRVEVRRSAIDGQGLFATASIRAGEIVGVLGGTAHRDDEVRGAGPMAHSSVAIDEGVNLVQDEDDPMQFGNHSCDPNLWLTDEVTTVARRDIRASEELTIDYALESGYAGWSMLCTCGAAKCRGRVTGQDWKLPDVQRAYRGHFSPFLERRIEALDRP